MELTSRLPIKQVNSYVTTKGMGILYHITLPLCTQKEDFFMENFAKEFMTHLNGKVSDDELAVILRELEVFSGNYTLMQKRKSH